MSDIALLRFQDLLPEHDEFDLGGGRKIAFRSRREFNAVDLGRLTAIEAKRKRAMDGLATNPADTHAATLLDEAIGEFVKFILPDLPDDILAKLYLGQKAEIIEWWTARQKTLGEEKADQPASS